MLGTVGQRYDAHEFSEMSGCSITSAQVALFCDNFHITIDYIFTVCSFFFFFFKMAVSSLVGVYILVLCFFFSGVRFTEVRDWSVPSEGRSAAGRYQHQLRGVHDHVLAEQTLNPSTAGSFNPSMSERVCMLNKPWILVWGRWCKCWTNPEP